jgi:NAD-dependent dihydropyrimidine dehydrogenase PreA subunit
MVGVSSINTLKFDAELCTGCGMCVNVCPHAVFALNHRVVQVVRPDACMECGACQRNCSLGAIQVESGVGCAAAMMRAALTGKKQVECGCN